MKMERKMGRKIKCKEITKAVTKNAISYEDYKNYLLTGEKQMRTMNIIRSDRREAYSEELNKVALCSKDDKRHILEDGIHTLARGHWRLRGKMILNE